MVNQEILEEYLQLVGEENGRLKEEIRRIFDYLNIIEPKRYDVDRAMNVVSRKFDLSSKQIQGIVCAWFAFYQ